jgi:hypothetical protein
LRNIAYQKANRKFGKFGFPVFPALEGPFPVEKKAVQQTGRETQNIGYGEFKCHRFFFPFHAKSEFEH